MKIMNSVKKYATRVNAVKTAAATGLMALAVGANAAVPAEVTSALTDAKADALSVGGIVLGIIVSIFALMLIRRVLK
ncbi:major capsid protein [Simonsiella muelleri]|uniref:Uncharacterized protein n=1 Tax=Simonsiella muelleri ATCC 29453 TaxID=641147 RepID=V9HBT7_9NEIS|nr:major capsid protein [Simonsiella muelleri]AUX61473.1 hypothetical protein BWP33_06395 [Simonsiella muelleri ATCC 29453]EFG30683.1 hypothetical protein HMPREF9021_01289 [Simonsiella muelleri ATCC 29453]UBQ53524.1 major capsid protein [Simonsiella muelleri]